MKALRLVGVLVAVALVAALVWRHEAGSSTRALAKPTEAPAVVSDSATCGVRPGAHLAYAVSSRADFVLAADVLQLTQVQTPAGKSEFAATLSVAGLSTQPDGTSVVLARFGSVNDDTTQVVGSSVTTSFLFKLSATCEVTAFARHQSTRRSAARVQQSALHDLWLSTDTSGAHDYRSGVGQAQVEMARSGTHFVRTTRAYGRFWAKQFANTQLVSSSTTFDLGAGWLESAHGVEQLQGGALESARTEFNAQRTEFDAAALAGASRVLSEYVWEDVLPTLDEPTTADATASDLAYTQRVAQMKAVSFDDAMDRFEARLTQRQNITQLWPDMAAFLDAHPERIDDYVATITDLEYPAGWKSAAFLALGQAHTSLARDALLGIYTARDEAPMDRVRSSLALATRRDVGLPLAQTLRAEAARRGNSEFETMVSRQSLLHLGVLAGAHASDTAVLTEAREAIEERLAAAREPADYSLVFHAFGNLGDASLLPRIIDWSRNTDPEVRAQVPKAMGRLKPDLTHDFTVEWLRRETSPEVKRELFDFIVQQYTDANRPITDALKTEALKHLAQQPLALTRQSLLRVLGPLAATQGDVRLALERQLVIELNTRSGLYSLVVSYLTPDDVVRALASVEGLRSQLAPVAQPGVLPVVAPEPTQPPSHLTDFRPTDLVAPPAVSEGAR